MTNKPVAGRPLGSRALVAAKFSLWPLLSWLLLSWLLLSWLLLAGPAVQAADEALAPLVDEGFSEGDAGWTFTDRAAWKVVDQEGDAVLALVGASQYKPKFRSPYNIALRREPLVGDFELTVRLRTTTKSYGHRDLCLFFGYQDPDHFYYVHLGEKADDHANQIFIVNGAPRTKISLTSTTGTPWDEAWHTVRVRRQVADGNVEVYFDDLAHPVMTARDATFGWGQVGLGSFDDTGMFDRLELRGRAVERPVGK